jgi:exoribonuclease II
LYVFFSPCLICFVLNQAGFAKALKMVEGEFLETVEYFKDAWLPARTIVQTSIEKRYEVVYKNSWKRCATLLFNDVKNYNFILSG